MTRRTLGLGDALHGYLLDHSLREHPVAARLREATAARPDAGMQVAPEQAQFMALLVRLTGARRVLEVGCFTGYSALVMALALPEDGRLTTLDVNEDTTTIARAAWAEAGVGERIELRLGLAEDSLDRLLAEGAGASFDLVFVDADKKRYDAYYERALELVRPGGLVLLDNLLWGGSVADPTIDDRQTATLRALTRKIQADARVVPALLPLGDGLMLAVRAETPAPA